MQYTHPALPDFISPAPFTLGEGDDAINYAYGWWDKADPEEIEALGFVEYVAPEPEPVEPTPPPVPFSVTRAQAKLALLEVGLLDRAEELIQAAGPEARIYWNDALNFERHNPYIEAIGAELPKTPAEIDDLFRLAATKAVN